MTLLQLREAITLVLDLVYKSIFWHTQIIWDELRMKRCSPMRYMLINTQEASFAIRYFWRISFGGINTWYAPNAKLPIVGMPWLKYCVFYSTAKLIDLVDWNTQEMSISFIKMYTKFIWQKVLMLSQHSRRLSSMNFSCLASNIALSTLRHHCSLNDWQFRWSPTHTRRFWCVFGQKTRF